MTTMAEFAGGFSDAPVAPWMFALAGREHSKRCVCAYNYYYLCVSFVLMGPLVMSVLFTKLSARG